MNLENQRILFQMWYERLDQLIKLHYPDVVTWEEITDKSVTRRISDIIELLKEINDEAMLHLDEEIKKIAQLQISKKAACEMLLDELNKQLKALSF